MNEGGQHEQTQSPIQIPGYTYGTSAVAKSPLSQQDFDRLKQSIHSFKTVPGSSDAAFDWIKQG